MHYNHSEVESTWQKLWEEHKSYKTSKDESKEKFYCLEMFPYPSGKIHMGHVRNYAIGDVVARYKTMKGFNVIHPMGWDAFGLPAENAAIKNKIHPAKWTYSNIKFMKEQLKKLGLSYDWDREIATCDPEYYKWEQLVFIKMFEKGLVYNKTSNVNWCEDCNTVLANEQVEDGKCWRCGNDVEIKELDGWFFKISEYADELLDYTYKMDGWPEKVLTMQRNWIGKSHGAIIRFPLQELDEPIEVFTTRPDTLYGANFMLIAPEHPLTRQLIAGTEKEEEGIKFINSILKEEKISRMAEDKEKKGFFTGKYVTNPMTNKQIPIYIANYVLMDYGTGAIMAVPAHDQRDFDFAKEYNLPITVVIQPEGKELNGENMEEAYAGDGYLVNSGKFNGLDVETAKEKITEYLNENNLGEKTVNYRLKDWGISRQRYWGAPIPVVHCEKCGVVPVKDEDLPVELPLDVEFTGIGNPLESAEEFVNTECPKCSAPAKRETDTMDTFVESSWYFLRYCSPQCETAPFNKDEANYWMPVDQYIGGVEHAIMHLLYARFYTKILRDLGFLNVDEPFQNLLTQGMVCKETYKCPIHGWLFPEEVENDKCVICDSDVEIGRVEKMSKSKKNVVDPDNLIKEYGADTARLFSLFAAPPDRDLEWNQQGVEGCYRFINRVFRLVINNMDLKVENTNIEQKESELSKELEYNLHSTIKKVTNDIEKFHLNTAVAACMEMTNFLYQAEKKLKTDTEKILYLQSLEILLKMLTPFVPHVCEELWGKLGNNTFISNQDWPSFDETKTVKDTTTIVVQINGKVRANIELPVGAQKEEALNSAKADSKVQKHLEGKNLIKEIYVPDKLISLVVK
ncbi:leucine--tRNA ligase [Flexistipes sinusarabici]|uniref:leucine--tRNA ligase n=1 Tax=Flexistipes sinusarabici TaxID=2352 RepID=UPI00235706E8|nr:leucine--tRNA ligase [Flexistipes sinusarabici]